MGASRVELAKRGFITVRVWDTEARNELRSRTAFNGYRGVSIAGVLTLPHQWAFYSDGDEYPYNIVGLSEHLRSAHLTVGYNTMSYDHVVVKAFCDEHDPCNELDLFAHVVKPSVNEAGLEWQTGDWTLESTCQRALGKGKLHKDGTGAAKLGRLGRWGELVTYNMVDVLRTAELLDYILTQRTLPTPQGDQLEVGDALDTALERVRNRATAVAG